MSIIIRKDPRAENEGEMVIIEFQGALNIDSDKTNGHIISEMVYNDTFKVCRLLSYRHMR